MKLYEFVARSLLTLAIIHGEGAKMMHSKTFVEGRAKTASLALVTSGSVGWKTIRYRWERDLTYVNPTTHHIDAYVADSALVAERGRRAPAWRDEFFQRKAYVDATHRDHRRRGVPLSRRA